MAEPLLMASAGVAVGEAASDGEADGVGDHTGNVCRAAAMEQVRKGLIEVKFTLPENCFRHSYISHRIAALDGNKPQVATEAGNSVGEIDRRYRVPLPKDEGLAWFEVRPATQPPTRKAPKSRS